MIIINHYFGFIRSVIQIKKDKDIISIVSVDSLMTKKIAEKVP